MLFDCKCLMLLIIDGCMLLSVLLLILMIINFI